MAPGPLPSYGDGISFWALGEIVKAHAGVLDGEPTEMVRAKILSSAADLIEDQQEASWVGQRLLELIRRSRRSSIRDQDEYSFWHDLVADVSYGQIPRQFRRDTHEAAGHWIETTAGERSGEVAEILAHHFSEALDLSWALGEDDPGLVQAARQHLLEAGRRTENLNLAKASALFGRALDLSRSPAEEAEVLIRLTVIVTNSVGGEEAVAMGNRALEAGSASAVVEVEAEAATVLSRAFWVAGDGDGSRRSARVALDLAGRISEGPVLTYVLSNAIGTLYLQGDHSGISSLIGRALDVGAHHGPRGAYLNALKWSGTYRCERGDPEEGATGIEELRRAYEGAVEGGFTQIQITTANNLASMLMNAQDMGEAIELYESTIAVGTARGLFGITDFARPTLAELYWHAGRWDQVVVQAQYLIDTYGDSNISGMGGIAWLSEHQIHTRQPDAEALFGQRPENSRRLQDRQALVPALGCGVEPDRQLGNFGEAMLLVQEFEKATEDRPFFRIQGLGYVLRLLEEAGGWDVMERLIVGVDGDFGDREASYRGDTSPTRNVRGIVALGRRHLDVATEEFEAALKAAIAAGSPWQQAMIVAHQAAVLIEREQSEAAAMLLDQADELLQILGGSVFDDYVAEQRARL